MVKRTNKSAAKKLRDSRSPMSLLRGKTKGLSIGEFSLEYINAFKTLGCFKNIILAVCSLFAVLAIMAQIRCAKSTLPPAAIDRSPSYKFYKSRFLKSVWADIVIVALGMYSVLPWLDADPAELEEAMVSNLDAGIQSNTPFIDKPTSQNFQLYYWGVLSRMSGLLNSCPATNYGIFNFPKAVRDAKVEDILSWMPFDEEYLPSVDSLISHLRDEILKEEENPSFAEDALSYPGGLTPIELQVFGDVMSRKPAVTARLERGSVLGGNAITRANLELVLSPTELAQYDLSAKFNPSKLKELSALAVARFNDRAAQSKESAQASVPGAASSEALVDSSSSQFSVPAPPVAGSGPGEVIPPKEEMGKVGRGRPKKKAVAATVDSKTVLASAGVGAKGPRTKGTGSSVLLGDTAKGGAAPPVGESPPVVSSPAALVLPAFLDPTLSSSSSSLTSSDSSVSEGQKKSISGSSGSAGAAILSSPSGSESTAAKAQAELGNGEMEGPKGASSAGSDSAEEKPKGS